MISPGSEAGITVEVAAAGLPGVQGQGAPGPATLPALLVTSVLTQHQCPQLAAVTTPAMGSPCFSQRATSGNVLVQSHLVD